MKKAIVAFLLVISTSCNLFQEKGIAFKIKNSSVSPITDIKIGTSENLENVTFERIVENESQEGFLSMKNNKMDGTYTLTFKHNGGTKEISEGYYTNGSNLESYISFEIHTDSIRVKFGEFPN